MTRFALITAAIAAVALASGTASAADRKPEPLTLKMSAYFTPSESDVIARMHVEPDPRSRELTIEWIAGDLSGGSHAITLDGANAAAIHQFAIKRMPEGEYKVVAILTLSDGTEIRRASRVTVIGMFPPSISGGSSAQGSAGRLGPSGRR